MEVPMETLPLAVIAILSIIGIIGVVLFVAKGNESNNYLFSGFAMYIVSVFGIGYIALQLIT